MSFGHEKLDVYRAAQDFIKVSDKICHKLSWKHSNMRKQIRRAAESIPLNIAEGNGKGTFGDRRRYFEIARGSAVECAASLDVLKTYGVIQESIYQDGKILLDRIAAMLTKLGGRTYAVPGKRK